MLLSLSQKWSRTLGKWPESGMGYQRVDVRLRDGTTVKNVMVFNAVQMDWPDDSNPINTRDIADISLSSSVYDTERKPK